MRNFISTPLISLKRKIASKFKVYNIDEYRTSCLSYKTETVCDNIILPDKKGRLRPIHSILTYQMKNKRMGCINRDLNSVNNMKKITESYLKNQTRPLKYCRGHKLDGEMIIKIPNPNVKLSGKQFACASASNGNKLITSAFTPSQKYI
jgi:antitoxin component YwqK of YwqJK toxin-antitoxin module